ncbi:recombinase family protein [Streptomyces sp. NPDC002962]|uniref:recombinase family protein n=1 Tax=Streptomyces sp. NPDC002962 TaxID=3364674 RepID=UPI0036AED080
MTAAREYLRVSKGKGRTARSIDDQHRDNLAAEQDHGPWTWGEAYRDTGSASKFATKSRDDFDRLTADLADGAFGDPGDVLVLWEISRLARETGKGVKLIDLCETAGYKIHVTSLDRTFDPSNYGDRHSLISGINDAEKEARLLSKRTKRGTDSALAEGRPHGKRPFGYARRYEVVDGRSRVVEQYPDLVEGPLVVELFERVAGWNGRERESIRGIALDWEKRGIVSREKGVPISAQNMRPMLLRKAYIGVRTHKGTESEGNWPAIVGRDLFDAVQEVLADPSRKSTVTSAVRHVLTGTLRCDVCGNAMTITAGDRPKRSGTGHHGQAAYVCRKYGCLRIRQADVDRVIIGDLEAVDPETGESAPELGAILAYLSVPHRHAALSRRPEAGTEESSARAELSRLRVELKELEAAPSPKTARARIARTADMEEIEMDIAALDVKLSKLTAPNPLAGLLPDDPGADLILWWKAAPVTAQRTVAALLLTPELLGQVRIKRVADSTSDAVTDRLRWVRAA